MRNDFQIFAGETRQRPFTEYVQPFSDTVANIKANNGSFANANTHQWSIPYDLESFAQVIITPMLVGVTSGDNIFSLSLMAQVWDSVTGNWINYPNIPMIPGQTLAPTAVAATGITLTSNVYTATSTGTYGLQPVPIYAFGAYCRFGYTMLNTSSGTGAVSMPMIFKG